MGTGYSVLGARYSELETEKLGNWETGKLRTEKLRNWETEKLGN